MADVFISYSKKNRTLTLDLARRIEAAGLSTWWDTELLDEDFREEIHNQLKSAKAVLVVWTPDSVMSQWVKDEAAFGHRKNKLINTHLDLGDPGEDIPFPFSNRNSIPIEQTEKILAATRKRIASSVDDLTDEVLSGAQNESSLQMLFLKHPKPSSLERIAQHARSIGRMPIETGKVSKRETRWLAPREQFNDGEHLPKLVLVREGTFQMGAAPGERGGRKDEHPRHPVTIGRSFAIGAYPVTVAEWEAARASGFDGAPQHMTAGNLPATHISWASAKSYTSWLRKQTGLFYRLPTEAEWEYACRAGSDQAVPVYAGQYDMRYSIAKSRAGSKLPALASVGGGRSPNGFNLYDMNGTVWEWVEDDYHFSYEGAPSDGSAWRDESAGSHKVLRGGCFASGPRHIRAARRARCAIIPNQPHKVGFRIARDL